MLNPEQYLYEKTSLFIMGRMKIVTANFRYLISTCLVISVILANPQYICNSPIYRNVQLEVFLMSVFLSTIDETAVAAV